MTGLADRARAMLLDALELYRDSPRATNWLRRHVDRLAEPLRVAVAGQPQIGKSTLVNSLVGEEVAPLSVEEGSQVLDVVPRRVGARARRCTRRRRRRGTRRPRGWTAAAHRPGGLAGRPGGPGRRGLAEPDAARADADRHAAIGIDRTPRTYRTPSDVGSRISLDADAVLYLMRQLARDGRRVPAVACRTTRSPARRR